MRQLAPDLEERGELDGRSLADGAAEQRPLGLRVEVIAVLHDVAGELPRPRTREGPLLRLRVELVQQVRLVGDEEQHLGRDPVGRTPGEPVLGVDPDLQVDEARCQRSRHAVHDAAVGLAVAAGNQRGALGELVFADTPVEDELVQSRLDHRDRGRQFFEVDEPAAGVVRRRKEGRGRPAGAVGAVAPRDAPQVDGVEQERPDVDVLAVGGGGNLPRDHRLGRPGRAPDNAGLAGLDQEREDRGELARAQRVVRGRCHVNHRVTSLWAPTPEIMQRSSLAATVSSRRRGIGGVFGGRPDGVGR